MSTIGIDFRIKTFTYEGKIIKLQIWDTAGQERFKNLTSTYYKGAHGVIFVFDTTDPISFESVDDWINDVLEHTGDRIQKVLLGNKSDLKEDRKVTAEEANIYSKGINMQYYDSSAKTGENIEKAFMSLTSKLKEKADEDGQDFVDG